MPAKPPEPTRIARLRLDRLPTPIGDALVLTDEDGLLRGLDWEDHEPRLRRLALRHYGDAELVAGPAPLAVRRALGDYFAGDPAAIAALAWRTNGTAFQRSVWTALRDIPLGETLSYAGLATRIGAPKAVRAVGLANGANPVGVVVPCHRVIGTNGSLTGYAGGLERKRWLLAHERAMLKAAA